MRISNRFQTQFLKIWHAVFSGGFIVAYVTADVYAMHLFSGTVVLGAVAIRVLVGLLARDKSPLALTNPMDATRLWWERVSSGAKARNPIHAWLAAALLGTIGLATATGWLTELLPFTKDLHEGVAEFTLMVITSHLALVFFKPAKKYVMGLVQAQAVGLFR